MAPVFRSKKKQTRIQFEALSGSPSASEKYSSSIKDRLANVRYSGARPKTTVHGDLPNHLPTPEPSSASRPEAVANFDPPHSQNIVSGESSPLSLPPSSPLLSNTTPNDTIPNENDIRSKDNNENADEDEDEDEDDILLPVSKRRKLGESDSVTSNIKQPRRSTRLTQSSPLRERRPIVHSKTSRSSKPMYSTSPLRSLSDIGSAESSGDEADTIVSKPLIRRRRPSNNHKNDDFEVDDDHVEYLSEQEPRKAKSVRKSSRNDIDDFMVADDEVEYITSDDEPTAGSSKRRKSRVAQKTSGEKAKRVRAELEEDLLDLQDSDHEEDDGRSRTRGGPVTTQRDQAKEHFARLKQQRAGKKRPRIIISDDSDADSRENLATDDDNNDDDFDIDNITRSPQQADPASRDSSTHSLIGAPEVHLEYDGGDDDNDDFIVEDTGATTSHRNSRPHPDIPLQFTNFASAKPKELFIHIVEWMVKNKISPAFARDDEIYDLSFSRIDDQVKAQAGSRLISAAWSVTFKRAILARPVMTVEALPGLDEDHLRTCDACNRTNHPARYDFKFSGTPYNKGNLEPIDIDDSDTDDKDEAEAEHESGNEDEENGDGGENEDTQSQHSTRPSYDSQGNILASSKAHFYLGRYCAASAEMGHKLTHWKHHLNTDVLSYLEDQQVLSATAIVARDKRSHKKREKEAENIVDAMQESGVIRELWERFQADLDDARWGMEGHEAGNSKKRSKARIGSVRVRGQGGRIGEWMEGGRYQDFGLADSDDSDAHR